MNSLEDSIKEFPEKVASFKNLKLKKEIPVKIRFYKLLGREIFIIESQIFEIEGVGPNKDLAKRDFITRFIRKYEEIQSFPNLEIKRLFDEYIEEVKFLYIQDSCGRYVKEKV